MAGPTPLYRVCIGIFGGFEVRPGTLGVLFQQALAFKAASDALADQLNQFLQFAFVRCLDALKSGWPNYPELRIALSESSIGWIPYFLERSDFSNWRHKAWTNSRFQDMKPSEIFRRHFLCCFIDDAFGLKHLEDVGEDIAAYETDYPHSDTLWPEAPEHLWKQVKHLSGEQIDKVTHKNAMRFFRFDPFEHFKREDLTVGALRAQAAAKGVDTTPISTGGARPVEEGVDRPVTSGDLAVMFNKHAETIAETETAA